MIKLMLILYYIYYLGTKGGDFMGYSQLKCEEKYHDNVNRNLCISEF